MKIRTGNDRIAAFSKSRLQDSFLVGVTIVAFFCQFVFFDGSKISKLLHPGTEFRIACQSGADVSIFRFLENTVCIESDEVSIGVDLIDDGHSCSFSTQTPLHEWSCADNCIISLSGSNIYVLYINERETRIGNW